MTKVLAGVDVGPLKLTDLVGNCLRFLRNSGDFFLLPFGDFEELPSY